MKGNRLYLAIIVGGLLCSGVLAAQRWNTEKTYNTYEINADYQDLLKLSYQENLPMLAVLENMGDAGVQSVGINEESIQSMTQDPQWHLTTYLSGYDVIIEGETEALQRIEKGLRETVKVPRAMSYEVPGRLRIQGRMEDFLQSNGKITDYAGNQRKGGQIWTGSALTQVGLGFDEKKIEEVKRANLRPNLRPLYSAAYQDSQKTARRLFQTLDTYSVEQQYMIPSGQEALGWDDASGMVLEELEKRKLGFALVEATTQLMNNEVKGQNEMIEKMQYQAIRAFTTWDYIQRRFDYGIPLHHQGEEIANTYFRAILERNVRVIYLKPFLQPDDKFVADPGIYKNVLSNLAERLQHRGIVPGWAKSMGFWNPNKLLFYPLALALAAAWILLLELLIPLGKKWSAAFYMLLAAGFCGLLQISPNSGPKALALAGAMVMPCLSVAYVLITALQARAMREKKPAHVAFAYGVGVLACGILISLGGALFEIGFLSGSAYLLEMDIFRGVKISQVIPMMVSVLLFFSIEGYRRTKNKGTVGLRGGEVAELMNGNMKIWQVVLLGTMALVVLLILARSGNDSGLSVAKFELLFRNILENAMPARPRTKSILMAYPALILLIYLAYTKQLKWSGGFLILLVAIGQSNIVNSFSHLRTPLKVSLERTVTEFVIAIFTGLILIGALYLGQLISRKWFLSKDRPYV